MWTQRDVPQVSWATSAGGTFLSHTLVLQTIVLARGVSALVTPSRAVA